MNNLKVSIFIYLFLFSIAVLQGKEKDVYHLQNSQPEIDFKNRYQDTEQNEGNKRKFDFFYLGLVQNEFKYQHSSSSNSLTSFSSSAPGINTGTKIGTTLFNFDGYFEVAFEWQKLKTEAPIFKNGIHLFQLQLIQNIFLNKSYRFFHFSSGLGIAPIYLSAEESSFNQATSLLGGSVVGKIGFIVPISEKHQIDLGLKGAIGKINGHDLRLLTLQLGINFGQ